MIAEGTVQTLEVAWVILLGFGAIASLYCLIDAWLDYRVVRKRPGPMDGDAVMIAQSSVLAEVVRLIEQVLLVSVGVWAMWIPPAPPHEQMIFERYFTAAFFAFGFGLTFNSILGLLVRRRFMAARKR